MIRTKYLLVVILACIGIIFSTGFLSSIQHTESAHILPIQEAHFAVPNDVYTVIQSYDGKNDQNKRNEFILKVQNEIELDNLVGMKEKENGISEPGVQSGGTTTPSPVVN